MDIRIQTEHIDRYKTYLAVEEAVRAFLKTHKYLRVELPLLSPVLIPESYLEVFSTPFHFLKQTQQLYLTPSPELFLKRLLAHGMGNCYYLGKSFRNSEPASSLHSHEFAMLEIYRMEANYMDLADDVLALFSAISKSVTGKNAIIYQGKKVSFSRWEKISVTEAFSTYAGVTPEQLFDEKSFLLTAKRKGYNVKGFTYEDVFSQIYVHEIEPNMGKKGYPTLLYDYPKQLAALAKLNDDGVTAQRFEIYIEGIELGDCYSELTDWKEQAERFMSENNKRSERGLSEHAIDNDYIKVLQYGLGRCAGIAIGFDRLAMLFTDATSIHDLRLITVK
jgi:lysyl-tRNA synthetase class 2